MIRSCGATLSLCNFAVLDAVYLAVLELRRRAFLPPGFFTPEGTHAHHHSSPRPQRRVVPAPGPPAGTLQF